MKQPVTLVQFLLAEGLAFSFLDMLGQVSVCFSRIIGAVIFAHHLKILWAGSGPVCALLSHSTVLSGVLFTNGPLFEIILAC